jgi:DNA-3-methyladenine glycosylase
MIMKEKILSPRFFAHDTIEVARNLIGKIIIRIIDGQKLMARIVETEAYPGAIDPASHSYQGKKKSNASLFGPVGHAYVYFTYGMHYCLNFVARSADQPAGGALIRSIEPITGIEIMQHYRHMHKLSTLTNGPGKLTQALHINKSFDGIDITKKGSLYVIDAPRVSDDKIAIVKRVGISNAKEKLWRFYEKGNTFISKR